MGINVFSLFDGMSCGRLALNKAGIQVDNYVASEVKPFAIAHTREKFPDTIEAGDVTKLHYENGKLYSNCKRWCIGDTNVLSKEDLNNNRDNIKTITRGGQTFVVINVVDLTFANGFDENNKKLANYKDSGLVLKAGTLAEDELNVYRDLGFIDLPNGELVVWEFDESNKIFEGQFDILIGGSPCQNFSLASSTNDEKYGLEGPKSRLFFDYIRLRNETKPQYYFLENVKMRGESKEALDSFLGNEGMLINSKDFSIQHRPRIYWTNLPALGRIVSDKTKDETNFQKFKLKTLHRLEWALYVKKFPGSYFGYEDGSIESIKGGFEFDEEVTDDTNRLVNKKTGEVAAVEGSKDQIRRIVNFNGKEADVSFSDEEASVIAEMNKWARKEVEELFGTTITDRGFVEFIHNQFLEAMVKKSPSRDNMRYGKVIIDEEGNEKSFNNCHNITDAPSIQCLTRKQDRFPNSGLISFGPYCRFVTKLEICKGQTVPYKFLGDLTYSEVQDVCGDGWTIDVIAKFFELIGKEPLDSDISDIDNNDEENEVSSERREEKMDELPSTINKPQRVKKSAPIPKGKVDRQVVFEVVKKYCDDKTYSKILYEVVGWKAIKKMDKEDVDEEILEIVKNEVRTAVKERTLFGNKELEEKFEWCML